MKLVILDAGFCPDCQVELTETRTVQPALFIGAGYGHGEQITVASCPVCNWSITRAVQACSPKT